MLVFLVNCTSLPTYNA
uniref:Uncharacterized protein n=1 Tax=Arundo donax TaxID=35708 RepID=A0A0A9FMV4_ARUDO